MGPNGFGTEAKINKWKEALKWVFSLCSLATRQELSMPHKIISINNFLILL
jgi:hypothetical protein